MKGIMLECMQWTLLAYSLVCVARLTTARTAADRLVALNVLSGTTLAFLVVRALVDNRTMYLDVALVYDMFGFLGFLAISRFLRTREPKVAKKEHDTDG